MASKVHAYDIETYPNVFTFASTSACGTIAKVFEISNRRNDLDKLKTHLRKLRKGKCRMVGFNNLGFDYPVIHYIMKYNSITAEQIYAKAMAIIEAQNGEEKFMHSIRPKEVQVPQIDLYKIHHFDNNARRTSLKMLEFNMRSANIEDLPFPVGKHLTDDEIDVLIRYNCHDVKETLKFYKESEHLVEFRDELSEKYGKDFTNFNDTKIGKEYFIMKLEESIPNSCYSYAGGTRTINQTKRSSIALKEVIFPYVKFKRPEFQAVKDWLERQVIKETKGVFTDILESNLGELAKYCKLRKKRKKLNGNPSEATKRKYETKYKGGWFSEEPLKNGKLSYYYNWNVAETLNTVIDGFQFDLGTGGAHGSIESALVKSDEEYMVMDVDVASMYPNISIANRVYPEHLTEVFCDVYKDVYTQRKSFAKGTPENAMMKLALNGVYGASNDKFSPFYDPKFTMAITINGQLSLAMLVEAFLEVDNLMVIQVNTDGVTVKFKREDYERVQGIYKEWEGITGLELEEALYSRMFIRDVNHYIAEYTDGKLKRKGDYEYADLGWHQNHSSRVIAMAAENSLVRGGDPEIFIKNHSDKFDFMLRTKVPRSSKLFGIKYDEDGEIIEKEQLQNICRYYACKNGVKLLKVMPPVEGKVVTEHHYKTDTGDVFIAVTKAQIERAERNSVNKKQWKFIETVIREPDLREIGIDAKWNVKICNNILDFKKDIDYDYYIDGANKLIHAIVPPNNIN